MIDPADVELRPVTPEDGPFLQEAYFEVRRPEIAGIGWDDAAQNAFLNMQLQARESAYRLQNPDAEWSVITVLGNDAGTTIIDRSDEKILIVDIAVREQYRRKGIAAAVIKKLQNEAGLRSIPVILRVDRSNSPAINIYQSLGFTVSRETDILLELEWRD